MLKETDYLEQECISQIGKNRLPKAEKVIDFLELRLPNAMELFSKVDAQGRVLFHLQTQRSLQAVKS